MQSPGGDDPRDRPDRRTRESPAARIAAATGGGRLAGVGARGLPFDLPMRIPLRQIGAVTGLTGPNGRAFSEPPPAHPPTGPPTRGLLAGEALGVLQLVRLLAATPRLARMPRGDGAPVVDMPGWRAPEASMAPLRRYLRRLGHDARTWGLGTNIGNPRRDAELMARSVAELAEETGREVALVGWSLGGVIAREVAREVPDRVSQVVTYGTPVIGGPNHTIAAGTMSDEERDRVEELIERTHLENPITVPVTAIFTRRDGIVSWPACIDRWTPGVRHVEVYSTHVGLGIDPDVWQVVSAALATR